MRIGTEYLFVILLASCGGGDTTPSLPPGAGIDAAHMQGDKKLLEEALTFFHPLPKVVDHPAGPDTPEKVALGEKLFMDPQLSTDGTISCNSCHRLDNYGVDGVALLGLGVDGTERVECVCAHASLVVVL